MLQGKATEKIYSSVDAVPELREVVMGLHWDPPAEGDPAHPGDLDALCVMLDAGRRVLEIVHPGNPRNANGSIVHTGDSRTGASVWDDERIFVFLEALPREASVLAFVVASANGHPFSDIRGASCHVSDHATEYRWTELELTSLGKLTAYCIATLLRGPAGWDIALDPHAAHGGRLADLLSVAAGVKRHGNGS